MSTPDELIGITSDQGFPDYPVPQFALEDFTGWPTSWKGVYSPSITLEPKAPSVNPPAGQAVDYLRLSVTDRCNYRCVYCMPPEGVPFKPHEEMLSYEEMVFFVRAAAQMGISKVRVTGGEPLVRWACRAWSSMIRATRDRGHIPDDQRRASAAGSPGAEARGSTGSTSAWTPWIPTAIEALTRGGSLQAALAGVEAAFEHDLQPVKLNVVMMPELLDELPGFVALTRERPLHVRFIEWMPVGGCGPRSAVSL